MLDELGASKPHAWVLDVLYSLLNSRYNRKKITIATSNFEDEPDPAVGRAREARGPHRLPPAQPPLRDVPAWFPLRGGDFRKDVLGTRIRSRF